MTQGFLNLLKPPGMTSSNAVVMVRGAFPKGTKVGHMGTLDPEAAGVLPIGIGGATRLFDYVSDKEKTYRAEVCIGVATDTQDATGAVTQRGHGATKEQLLSVLPQFVGEITQVPSMYSAIKVGGRKLYEAARAGECIEVPSRTVHIYGIDYIACSGENRYMIDVHCGRGTYIRSLCHDIGQALGTCAHMSYLLRSSTGIFGLDTALTPEQFLRSVEKGEPDLLACDMPIGHIPAVHVSGALERVIQNGNPIRTQGWEKAPNEGDVVRVYMGDQFVGMGQMQRGEIVFRCMLLRRDA